MIEAYNSGALSIEEFRGQLITLGGDLTEEEKRHMRENVSEEELAVFDILTRPGRILIPRKRRRSRRSARICLAKLKTELLVIAWRNKRTTRAAAELFEQKCGVLFQHVLEKYPDEGRSVYGEVG